MLTRVQIMKEAVCISQITIIFREVMSYTILPQPMRKIVGHTVLFNLGMATSQEE